MIDNRLFMMIYKPSKLIYSSVHIDRVYHFIRDHFSRIPLFTYISFNGPVKEGCHLLPTLFTAITTPNAHIQRPEEGGGSEGLRLPMTENRVVLREGVEWV